MQKVFWKKYFVKSILHLLKYFLKVFWKYKIKYFQETIVTAKPLTL